MALDPARPHDTRVNRAPPPATGTNLYVAGINYICTPDDLRTKLGAFGGGVVDVRMARAPNGRSKGFAFVEMQDEGGASEAITALDGAQWNGRVLLVERARQGLVAMSSQERSHFLL